MAAKKGRSKRRRAVVVSGVRTPFVKAFTSFTKLDTIAVDTDSKQTDSAAVFAGGDVVLGPSTVVQSMGQGRRAA